MKIPDINTQNLYITAKLTSEAENKGDILPDEPDSWFAKKKKSFEKANRRTRRHCRKAVKSQGMFWLIIILVFLNTCVLATEHYRQPAWLDYFQEYVNLFFVVLFTFEMVLKMYSLGFQVSQIYFYFLNYTYKHFDESDFSYELFDLTLEGSWLLINPNKLLNEITVL